MRFWPAGTHLGRRVFRLPARDALPFTATPRRLYILPTRLGLAFGLLLLGMLLAAMNYGLSMAFLFTFLLSGMVLSALFATWRVLLGARIARITGEPGFAGGDAAFTLTLSRPARREAARARLRGANGEAVFDLPASEDAPGRETFTEVSLRVPAPHRGRLALGAMQLESESPLSLFRVWCVCAPDAQTLVWPAPAVRALPLPALRAQEGGGVARLGRGAEDFDGLAAYQPGEPLSRLAWKSLARQHDAHAEPLVKTFVAPQHGDLWLDWQALPGLDAESRLSHLTRWVLEADQRGLRYGLRLPGLSLAPGSGATHRLRCLNSLAVFETAEAAHVV